MRVLVLVLSALLLLTGCVESSRAITSDPTAQVASTGGASRAPSSRAAASCATGVTDGMHTIRFHGATRRYYVHVPSKLKGVSGAAVVFVVHGLSGYAKSFLSYTRFADAANKDGFITVSPQGAGHPTHWDFRTPPTVAGSDANFILKLTKVVKRNYCADGQRFFYAGFSNGSAMAFSLACSNKMPFRAYGAVSASTYTASCNTARDASIIYFHGTADPAVPFNGGNSPIGWMGPVRNTLAEWAQHDRCESNPVTQAIGTDVVRRDWLDCDNSRLVAYYVRGGKHAWPGAGRKGRLAPATQTISATDLMVSFFGLDRVRQP